MNCGYKNVIFFNSFSYSFLDNNSQPIIHWFKEYICILLLLFLLLLIPNKGKFRKTTPNNWWKFSCIGKCPKKIIKKDLKKIIKIEITKENADENDALIICYQFLSNYILKMSQNHRTFATNVHTEIIEPFTLVTHNFKSTNKEISNETFEVLCFISFHL